ncbi:hypothetical protein E2562_005027 [Oryza meyeriana var. granulata]|uniref:Late embryogenesis abundant protein LEA-2 subgroup domain-containing protein n=1 Tax=Oryza meyeriana var. granulata TaxID=110450 RepID=A0A6G1BR77_9ORYZ|nr:hypothetical protein E2562_005027 [Oryza meyeriana var. granulata]
MVSDKDAETSCQAPAVVSGKHILITAALVVPLVILLGYLICPVFFTDEILLPTFSVDLAGFDGLDGPTPPPTISPAFNLTLHAVGSRPVRLPEERAGVCQERGTVAVSYAGAVLAWGRVPGFCVGKHEDRLVRMVAVGAEVGLSDELHHRMASERRSRAAELDVDLLLERSMLDAKRLLSCRVKLDEPSSSSPSLPSPCRVIALYGYDIIGDE